LTLFVQELRVAMQADGTHSWLSFCLGNRLSVKGSYNVTALAASLDIILTMFYDLPTNRQGTPNSLYACLTNGVALHQHVGVAPSKIVAALPRYWLWLPPSSLTFSRSVCFRTAPYKFWNFQDVSGRQGQCFTTDFQSFKMVHDRNSVVSV
jgi:hypothetical protein